MLQDDTHKLPHIDNRPASEFNDHDHAPNRSTAECASPVLHVVRTTPRRYEHPGVSNQTFSERPSDLRNASKTNLATVSSSFSPVRLYSKALQQDGPFERFDLFVPDKAAINFPQIRFQDPAKVRSSKALNMTERVWNSTAIYVSTNVRFTEAACYHASLD